MMNATLCYYYPNALTVVVAIIDDNARDIVPPHTLRWNDNGGKAKARRALIAAAAKLGYVTKTTRSVS